MNENVSFLAMGVLESIRAYIQDPVSSVLLVFVEYFGRKSKEYHKHVVTYFEIFINIRENKI